jgi:acyl-CoA reductase-like NAD-dependent aldehyde dehydrogenase
MKDEFNTETPEVDVVRSPFDGSIVGHMPISDADAVERSIKRAQAAFEIMRNMPRFARADILHRAADLMESRRDEFVRTIAGESGKPLYDARGEVSRGIFNLRNAAAEARRSHGEEVPLDVDAGVFEYQTTDASGKATALSALDFDKLAGMRRRVGLSRRFPIGLILAISPFNFPLNLVLHKVAPAIAVGNAVVLKPAPQTPLTSRLIQEVLRDAGLPDGALEVCHCSIPLAESMVRDEPLCNGDVHRKCQGGLAYQIDCGPQKGRARTRGQRRGDRGRRCGSRPRGGPLCSRRCGVWRPILHWRATYPRA